MKSAYELALERLDKQGIERPSAEALDDETRARVAAVRSKAQAELAELEILRSGRAGAVSDPIAAAQAEKEYLAERRRIEDRREREVEQLRAGTGESRR